MQKRWKMRQAIGFMDKSKNNSFADGYGDLNRFPAYVGTHPAVMKEMIEEHHLSREDFDDDPAEIMVEPCFLVSPAL